MKLIKIYVLLTGMLLVTTFIYGIEEKNVFFQHITVDNGLSNNSAICFGQDREGLIWIGTNDGLNMYNSVEFQVFRHQLDDTLSLSNNRVKSIVLDNDSNLWIGTEKGLNRLIADTYQFKRYYCDSSDKKSDVFTNNINIVFPFSGKIFLGTDKGIKLLNRNQNTFGQYPFEWQDEAPPKNVTSIKKDSRGNLWVGTHSGLYYFDSNFKLLTTFPEIDRVSWGQSIVEDHARNIWVCTTSGIFKITNIVKGKYDHFNSIENRKTSINTSFSWGATDGNGNLWLATGKGLAFADKHGEWSRFTAGRGYGKLNDNYIRSVFFDRQGNMWVGTDAGGINLYHKHRKKFKYLSVYQEEGKRLLSNKIKGLFVDDDGMIWLGAEGLNKFNPVNGSVKHWEEITKIISINQDHAKNIWVSTENGIYKIDRNEKVTHYQMNSQLTGANYVHDIHVTDQGHVIAGTWGGGLWEFIQADNSFQPIKQSRESKDLYFVKYFYVDRDNQLWAGNDAGIFMLNDNYVPVFSLTNSSELSTHLSGTYTYCMYQDIEGNYWIGTNRGLQYYNPDTKKTESFGHENGLRNEVILGIVEDKENNLWLTTYSGLVKFNRVDRSVRVFTSKDGLISNQFSQGSIAINPVDQNLYLGSLEGLVYFDPLQLEIKTIAPQVVFTDFRVYNKSVKPGKENTLLGKHISQTNSIELPYKYSVFSFNYVGLNYGASKAVEYAYKLEGFDNNWRNAGNTRSATYTNLKPGDYQFKVRAANEDGIWSEESGINLTVLHPWWLKWYSFIAFSIFLFGLLLFARRIIISRHKLENKVKIQELEHEQENKLNDLKIQFFTSVSHEFRTPLTLISGPLEDLLLSADKKSDTFKHLTLIKTNVNRLLGLVNQLLEFRKIEKGKVQLNASKNDIVLFTKRIVDSFSEFALEKGIRIKFNTAIESRELYIDPMKIETVIYNVLMNAIKYNSFQSEIDINIEEHIEDNTEKVYVSVTDYGIGISKEDLSKIFERFYQASRSNILGGTGIGLALAKEFAQLNGGDLTVESEENVYTCFTLKLLKGKDHLDPAFITENKVDINKYKFKRPHIDIGPSKNFRAQKENKEYTIALVEDNDDVRSYLKNLLSFDYNVVEYKDGKEAFENIIINIPNLVITDVMMPLMDGFELCQKLRNEIRTCHIPVVMLTAKDFMESELKGIENGADAYITKPFSNLHLKVTVKNLILSRKKIEYRYSIDNNDQNLRKTSISNDEIFLKRFYAYIDQNISNPDLDINNIIDHFNISRVQLYRKLISQTNLSANKIIKNYRLQKAKELLLEKRMNISEIAYAVGFSDSLYFSKCFKEKFKVSPSHYIKKKHKVDS
ncbi:MAG: response regulator [Bacteroidetes bacterium]|jgi:signal transduction histidine kinase/AraC-like DNA-binding protein/streptogramin lyase|nr:response regulator [Bacteroidota bacterium]